MNRSTLFLICIFLITTISCGRNGKSRLHINTSNLYPEQITVKQYGKALFEADLTVLETELRRLQAEFIHFLDADLSDTANIKQIHDFVSDTSLIMLYHKSREIYPDIQPLENELTHAFRRFHYHFPKKTIPDIYTYISGVQYEMPVMFANKIAVIAIDCYLGEDYNYYKMLGIPGYIRARMTSDHLVNDLFKTLFMVLLDQSKPSLSVLDEMIMSGKRLYFQEAMQPQLDDHIIIGYKPEQYIWVQNNEAQLWAYLVGEEVLFSNDFHSFKRLFNDGPFSSDFSHDAPARLGEWVGWQIVRNYMQNHPETSIEELIKMDDSQQILSDSRYRPK